MDEMRAIKLTPSQTKNLTQAIQAQGQLEQAFRIAQAQLNSAANHRQGIFEMICEAHGIDAATIDQQARINLKDDVLTISEVSASARIKKDVNKKSKSNGHDKVKA
jgi:hypothetical protein